MISSIIRRTAWKLWGDIIAGFAIIGFFMMAFAAVFMGAGTIAALIITISDWCGVDWWRPEKLEYAYRMVVIGPLFWAGVWLGVRVRQSIRELRR